MPRPSALVMPEVAEDRALGELHRGLAHGQLHLRERRSSSRRAGRGTWRSCRRARHRRANSPPRTTAKRAQPPVSPSTSSRSACSRSRTSTTSTTSTRASSMEQIVERRGVRYLRLEKASLGGTTCGSWRRTRLGRPGVRPLNLASASETATVESRAIRRRLEVLGRWTPRTRLLAIASSRPPIARRCTTATAAPRNARRRPAPRISSWIRRRRKRSASPTNSCVVADGDRDDGDADDGLGIVDGVDASSGRRAPSSTRACCAGASSSWRWTAWHAHAGRPRHARTRCAAAVAAAKAALWGEAEAAAGWTARPPSTRATSGGSHGRASPTAPPAAARSSRSSRSTTLCRRESRKPARAAAPPRKRSRHAMAAGLDELERINSLSDMLSMGLLRRATPPRSRAAACSSSPTAAEWEHPPHAAGGRAREALRDARRLRPRRPLLVGHRRGPLPPRPPPRPRHATRSPLTPHLPLLLRGEARCRRGARCTTSA